MNPDHAIAVVFGDMLQQLQIGLDEMRPTFADDAKHLGCLIRYGEKVFAMIKAIVLSLPQI